MNVREQVAKLESLLARVGSRRNAPRKPVVQEEPPQAVAVPEAALVAPPPPAPARVAEPVVAKAAVPPAAPPKAAEPVVAKPAAAAQAPRPAEAELDEGVVLEEGLAEVDLEGIEDEAGVAALSDSVADLDALLGDEHDEPPVSSQRPIHAELALEELAFGDGDAAEAKQPPHSTPPESGRQAASPPASEELVRSAARAAQAAPPAAAEAHAAPPAAPAELTADVTRPVIPMASPAVFRGALPAARPATLGDLLDATLAL